MKFLLPLAVFILSTLSHIYAKGLPSGMHFRTNAFSESKCVISLDSPFSALPYWGHYPVTATIRNDGTKSQTFTITADSNSSQNSWSNSSDTTLKSNFSIQCNPGETKSFELLIPIAIASTDYDSYGFGYSHSSSTKASVYNSTTSSESNIDINIKGAGTEIDHGISTSIPSERMHMAATSSVLSGNLSNATETFVNESSIDLALFATELKGMIGYDAFILTDLDWTSLNSSQQRVFQEWIRAGGYAIILNTHPTPTKQFKDSMPGLDFSSNGTANFNAGIIEIIPKNIAFPLDDSVFYKVLSQRKLQRQAMLSEDFSTNNYNEGAWPLKKEFGTKAFGTTLLAFILVIFAILVGPINFFVFAGPSRRHRLFVTTPIIALGTSALLIALIFLKDGIGGDGARIVLREIDAGNKKSYVYQEQFCRTGMLLSGSFDIANDYSITQVPIAESRWSRVTNGSQKADISYTQQREESSSSLSGDYFTSRSEHAHYIQGDEVTQESIKVRVTDDQCYLTSTFPNELSVCYFKGSDGNYWKATNLTTGNEVTAENISNSAFNLFRKEQALKFSNTLSLMVNRLAKRNNSFIALSDQLEGVDTHTSIDWKTTTVLTGAVTLN